MKVRLMKIYLIVVSVVCVVAVCLCLGFGREAVPAPEASIQIDDFIIKLSSQQYSYEYRDINPSAPFHFELTVEYVGNEPEIEITHGSSIGVVDIVDPYRETKFANAIGAEKVVSTLEKNKQITYVFTGRTEFEYLGGFSRGNYSARAFGLFSTEDKRYEFRLSIPFVIE